jgi:hypothetical protein
VILLLMTYVLPMCAMVACYSAMGRELWGSRSIGEQTQRQVDSIRSKRKVRILQALFTLQLTTNQSLRPGVEPLLGLMTAF